MIWFISLYRPLFVSAVKLGELAAHEEPPGPIPRDDTSKENKPATYKDWLQSSGD